MTAWEIDKSMRLSDCRNRVEHLEGASTTGRKGSDKADQVVTGLTIRIGNVRRRCRQFP